MTFFAPGRLMALFLALAGGLRADDAWTLRHQVTGGSTLSSLTAGDYGLVVVGGNGRILHSDEGASWQTSDSGTSAALTAVAFGQGRYVAVGESGTILVSGDGQNWSAVANSATNAPLNQVRFAQDKFIAVGEGGTVVTSPNGSSWSTANSKVSSTLRGLAFGGNFWIAVGDNGALTSSEDGKTWTSRSTGVSDTFVGAAFCEAFAEAKARFLLLTAGGATVEYALQRTPIVGGVQVTGSAQAAVPTVGASTKDVTWGNPTSLATCNQAFVATADDGAVITSPSYRVLGKEGWSRSVLDAHRPLTGAGSAGDAFFVLGVDETIYQSKTIFSGRLANISVRGPISGGSGITVGTVLRGDSPKNFLVRAVGPRLQSLFNFDGALADPMVSIYDGPGTLIAKNAGWSTDANAQATADATKAVGTFDLPLGSSDSALVAKLKPGSYTFQAESASGGSGTALVEAYDLGALSESTRLVNLSVLSAVSQTNTSLIAGISISGSSGRTLLIRAVGPTLSSLFGVRAALLDPVITIYRSDGMPVMTVDGWFNSITNTYPVSNNEMRTVAVICGAFPLVEPGNDSSAIVNLPPGTYTAHVTSKRGNVGSVLLEIYEIPSN